MRLLRVFRQRVRSLFRSAQVDGELENELAYRLEQLTKENIASGMEPAEARFEARRTLGGMALLEEQCRDRRRVGWLADMSKDVVYAWRMLLKSPGFTALAVLTLALGVGAGIAVYKLAESLLLRSLPYPSPERLAAIYSVHARRGTLESIGQEDFRDWQASNTVFERMAVTEFDQMTLVGRGDPRAHHWNVGFRGLLRNVGCAAAVGPPVYSARTEVVRTMKESVDLATAMPRGMMALVAGFGCVTLGMATLGLGGVMPTRYPEDGAKLDCA